MMQCQPNQTELLSSNKRRGGAKVAKSINVEVGINVEGGIFWKKLVYK
jgi:hypothetical protein